MHVIKAFFISFSIYSKIPVPQFDWKEEDMRYTLCFFPIVGVVIGLVELLWYIICRKSGIGILLFSVLGTAIPIMISGGFHVDGFMDTMDALHSYQPREKKLEILKDPHIGSFSVIMLVLYYLLYVGAFSEIMTKESFLCFVTGFVLSRAFSGLGVIYIPSAKKDGMLAYFSKTGQKMIVTISLILEIICCIAWNYYWGKLKGLLIVLAAVLVFIYYVWKSKKEFGGITGDLAGFFVTLCELFVVFIAAIQNYIA